MSANSLDKKAPVKAKQPSRWGKALLLTAWTLLSFIAANVLIGVVIWVMGWFGVSFATVNEAVYNTVLAALIYTLTLAITVIVPKLIKGYATSRQEVGLSRLPSWMDIGLGPAGYVLYLIGSAILIYLVSIFVPFIDLQQVQQTGFDATTFTSRYEYILAFATLVIVAPVAEEILFRGYLYGKLRKTIPLWATMLLVSLLFSAVHMQWNVAIDVFVLSIIACILREITGSIWAGTILHMIKNAVAFYFLFINPSLLTTMGM